MGKKLRQQRRGKNSNAYTKLPGTYDIDPSYAADRQSKKTGEVTELINHTGHTAPLVHILYEDMTDGYLIAPEGIKIGDKVQINAQNYSLGSVMRIGDIAEGTPIYNIESIPGDGGKLTRAAGASASILAHSESGSIIQLRSKQKMTVDNNCRAQLGVVAGVGMNEAPIMKAGKNHYIKHALNRYWPRLRGVKMQPSEHPFGGKQHHKGKSSMTSRNAPPGRKVGHIAARRIGRKKKG